MNSKTGRVRRVLLAAPALLWATACGQQTSTLPGTALGNYNIVGTLGANTCGSTVGAANPWDFALELSRDSTMLYIAQTDGSDALSGALDTTDALSATLSSTVTSNVDGSDAGPGPCNLTQSTTFALTLASGATPQTFSGTVTYAYGAATGVSATTDCTDQLSASGGPYATLPCTVTYSLAGTHQ